MIKIDETEFEEVSPLAVHASQWLTDAWEFLGKPQTPLTESGAKLMNLIIAVWEELYSKDAKEWYATRTEYKTNELSIRNQVHQHTGRSLASYPMPVYQMMKKVFPTFKLSDKKTVIKFVRRFPLFQMANKV